MSTTRKQRDWNQRVALFNKENAGRRTRLGVFEPAGTDVNDYWLEDGLPLRGVGFEERGDRISAQILLDGYTHVVEDAKRFELLYDADGIDNGLNVIDSEGRTSILRFE